MNELKTHVSTLWNVHNSLSIHCADQKQHSNPDFFNYSDSYTLEKRVITVKENLQA